MPFRPSRHYFLCSPEIMDQRGSRRPAQCSTTDMPTSFKVYSILLGRLNPLASPGKMMTYGPAGGRFRWILSISESFDRPRGHTFCSIHHPTSVEWLAVKLPLQEE